MKCGAITFSGAQTLERVPITGQIPCRTELGQGLFLGVELVANRQTREPAAEMLASAIERSRDTGVLLSSDGPDHNVLKIKPPMPFTEADADLLLSVFDCSLQGPDDC